MQFQADMRLSMRTNQNIYSLMKKIRMASSTVYAVGTMLGPLIGGLIVTLWGWVGLCLVIGLSMFVIGSATTLLELIAKPRQFAINLCHNDLGEECAKDSERDVDKESSVKKSELTVQPEAQVTSLESKSLTKEPLSHWTALCKPWVTVSCLTMVASGVSSSWYLSSLESHLSVTLELSPTQISLVYMCPGFVYALLTPLTGFLLDRGLPHLLLLIPATSANLLGYLLLGPSPLLIPWTASPQSTVCGLLLHGLGLSTTLITCLSLMTEESKVRNESDAFIVTSLWECSEQVGGYLGSTIGGIAASSLGFQTATTFVFFLQLAVLVLIIAMAFYKYRKMLQFMDPVVFNNIPNRNS